MKAREYFQCGSKSHTGPNKASEILAARLGAP
jgi:hypothetical protein